MPSDSPVLLRVDTSLHSAATSASRAVADFFEAAWVESGGQVRLRDVGANPLPYLTEVEHSATFVPEEHRTPEQRDAQTRAAALADELFDADVLLLCSPLYNLNIAATLKTWIDHLFTDLRLFPGYGINKPLAGRTAVVVNSRGGGYGPGAPMEGWNYESVYLRRILADISGYELREIPVELTLAESNPAMADLVATAHANRRNAEDLARLLGKELAESTRRVSTP